MIGHLWHVVPGAHYDRMYGKDYTPNTYALIKSCSDHIHYAGKVGARDGLASAHQIQDDAAVDLTRGASRGNCEP